LIASDQAAIRQPFEADQKRIARKGRSGRIRRVAETQRTERQNLPEGLFRGSQKIRECVRGRTEVADPAAGRQRRGMQQDSAGAGKRQLATLNSQLSGNLS
jgi:hypothetical protein